MRLRFFSVRPGLWVWREEAEQVKSRSPILLRICAINMTSSLLTSALMAWPRPRSLLPHWKALSLGGSGCGQPTFREGEVCTTPLRPRPEYKSCGSLCGSFVPICLNQHGSMGGSCILWVIIQYCIILVLLFQLWLSGAPVSFDTLLQADHLVCFLP